MINTIKCIADKTGELFSVFYFPKMTEMCRAVKSHIYTGMIKSRFKSFGKGSLIDFRTIDIAGMQYISIGENSSFAKDLCLTAWDEYSGQKYNPEIIIGNNCSVGSNMHITSVSRIEIGDNLLTGCNVLITDNTHGSNSLNEVDVAPAERPLCSKGGVKIGNNVWLCNNVCVLAGVTIGDGVVVGANSVVSKDVPPYTIVAGIPAEVVKTIQ